ncbi:hypothetical protein C7212DRAFT_363181 [Tuber magnatum]|uniref:Uncharacterized protein n=1 Tax=Tuber magnatum TaxID=42249 RepID=A0A317SS31_9PEZI|nr:hypothetical protein C7212DRAFT_363181 [Tuber magnatum]
MCIQTITAYACSHLSTAYNTTTPHCSTTSICTLQKPLPTRNEKSTLLCAKCLAEKIEREANQMRELEHFARVSGGEVKVAAGGKEKTESEVKNVKVIAKDLEELGFVTEGLLKRAAQTNGGNTHSVLEEHEEVFAGTTDESGAEKGAVNAEEVKIDEKPIEEAINPMGVYVEVPSALEQVQPEEPDALNLKDLSLEEPAQKPDAKSASRIGKPKAPTTNKSGKSLPGPPPGQKSLELKDTKTRNHTPERSSIPKSTSTLIPKKSVKFSTPPKTNDTAAAGKGKGKGRGSKPPV